MLTGLVGFPIYATVESAAIPGELFIALVGAGLIVTGFIQKIVPRLGTRKPESLGVVDTLLIGVVQGLSAYPGASRSGLTVSSFLFRGFTTETALNLSFLMSIPAVLASQIGLALTSGFAAVDPSNVLFGCSAAFVSGLLSIQVMLKVAQKIQFWAFCIVIGALALLPILSIL